MSIRLGDEAPDFTAQTTQGDLSFHDWKGKGWAVLFSHPKDFTLPSASDDDAKAKFPKGFVAKKPYLRVTPQPNK